MPSQGGTSRGLPAGYTLVQPLGSGASGSVVLAEQTGTGRLVAVKTVLTGRLDEAGQLRLEREGKVLVELRHPHIVDVIALSPSPEGAALVLEYVPGGNLQQAMESAALPRACAAALLAQVASALHYAHEHKKIVHRDVKPANVLLGAPGDDGFRVAKVADFGLARLPRAAGAFRTRAGGSSGTPLYMAPEQIEAPDDEAPPIDVYSFSVMAYQVLTGSLPYRAANLAGVLEAHLHQEPIRPWDVAHDFPADVGDVLLAGLAKSPWERPTLAEVRERIERVSPGEWAAVRPVAAAVVRPSADPGTTRGPTQAESATLAGGATLAEGPNVLTAVTTQYRPGITIIDSPAARSSAALLDQPVYRPPRAPFLRRRVAYLSLALALGSALGVCLVVVLTGIR